MRRLPFLFLVLLLTPRGAWAQGTPLGPEFRISTFTTGNQDTASVASDPSGNFVVVWDSYLQDGSSRGVFGQRYDSAGVPVGPEFRVNTFTTSAQYRASAAADSLGNFVVVWTSDSQDAPGYGVFGQRYDSSGTPVGPEFRVNTYTTDNQRYPSVAADASGDFVVVWNSSTQDGSLAGIFGQRYASSGTPFGAEFRVNTYTTNNQGGYPVVASDSSGNFVVVWSSSLQDGSNYGVFGQRYASSGTPLGPEFRVNTHTTDIQRGASVTSDSSGNFVVVWRSFLQDGSNYGVFGQRYASSGTPLGPEFRVTTYTTGGQTRPVVTADSTGNFVVVWSSHYQDGSGFGILGQRYGQIVPVES